MGVAHTEVNESDERRRHPVVKVGNRPKEHTMSTNRVMLTISALITMSSLFVLNGCSSDDSSPTDSSGNTSSASAVTGAQEGAQALNDTVQSCFDDFKTCNDAGTDRDTCKTQLDECLPERPEGAKNGPPPCGGPGGKGPHGPPPGANGGAGGSGGAPPMPPEGMMGGSPPDGAPPCDGDGKGPPPQGAGGPGHPPPGGACLPPGVAAADFQACHDSLDECLAGDAEDSTCFDTFHSCTHDLMQAAFDAMCEEKLAECDAADPKPAECDEIATRCAEGLPEHQLFHFSPVPCRTISYYIISR